MADSLKRWEDVSNQAISTFTTNRPNTSNWGYLPSNSEKAVKSPTDIAPTPYMDSSADLFNTSIREAFNTEFLNVKRYYEHPAHKRLGYSLYRDNESYYNQNTAWTGDFIRAMKHFGPGYADGFMSNYNGIATLFSGKALTPSLLDKNKGRKAEEAASIAMSTRGGLGQSMVNIPYNLNYTLGIATSMIAEDLALAALIPETAGASGVALVGNTVMDAGRIVKSLFNLGRRAKDLDKVNDARKAWQSLRAGAASTFIPETARVFRGAYKAADGATDIARMGNATKQLFSTGAGFGAVYRDLRLINLAIDESGVEAVGVRNSRMTEMLQEFSILEGRMPDKREYEAMVENANSAMTKDYFANLPVIYFTNQITFGNMGIKPRFIKNWARTLTENSAGKIVSRGVKKSTEKGAAKELGKRTFEVVEKAGTLKTVANIFTKRESAKDFLLSTGKYFKRNFSEGAQELYQNFAATSLEDYYRQIYADPKMAGFKGYSHATKEGFANMFSQEGFEAFMGGILGGGAVNTLTKNVQKGNEYIMQKFNPETYESNREIQKQRLYDLTDALNKDAQDVAQFLAPDIKTLVDAVKANESIASFAAEGNFKGLEDVRAVSLYAKINSLEATGATDTFIEALEEMKDLSEAEKIEAFGTETATQADQIIDTVVGRTKKIQANHQMVNEMFPIDRFNPNEFKIGTPERNQEIFKQFAYEQAKLDLIFNMNQYSTIVERVDAIYGSAVQNTPVAGMQNTDFSILFNSDVTKANGSYETTGSLEEERDLTKVEIKRLEDSIAFSEESKKAEGVTPETKAQLDEAIASDKKALELQKEKSDLLADYQQKLYAVADQRNDKQLSLFPEMLTEEAEFKKALQNYLAFVAKSKNVFKNAKLADELAEKILDVVSLSEDMQSAITVINALSDEENLNKRADVHKLGIEQAFEYVTQANKQIVMLDALKGPMLNELIQALEEIGVAIETEDLISLMVSSKPPTKFLSNVAGSTDENGQVIEGSPLWEQIQEILDQFEISLTDLETDISEADASLEKPAADTKTDLETFVETGEASENLINSIARKLKDGEELTKEEQAVYQDKSKEIESKLKEFAAEESVEEERAAGRLKDLSILYKKMYGTPYQENPGAPGLVEIDVEVEEEEDQNYVGIKLQTTLITKKGNTVKTEGKRYVTAEQFINEFNLTDEELDNTKQATKETDRQSIPLSKEDGERLIAEHGQEKLKLQKRGSGYGMPLRTYLQLKEEEATGKITVLRILKDTATGYIGIYIVGPYGEISININRKPASRKQEGTKKPSMAEQAFKKPQKAKYQVKQIESDLEGTTALEEIKKELNRENARRKAKGEKQFVLQQFINSVPLAEELIKKGYEEVETYKRQEQDNNIINLFKKRIAVENVTIDKLNEIKQETLDSLNDVINFPEAEFEKAKMDILAREMNIDAEEQQFEPVSDENKEAAQANMTEVDFEDETFSRDEDVDNLVNDIDIC